MNNTGKSLEQLVKQIEEICLPKGLSISVDEQVFDEKGNQLAEFDIIISGKIGTTSFKWLIECRDRPSDGPAPGSWIEQLVGRRDRFALDKVIAVSTTGFARGAKGFAKQKGIELRSVEMITSDSITEWLKISEVDVKVNFGHAKHITLIADKHTDAKSVQALKSTFKGKNFQHKQALISTQSGESTSVFAIWQNFLNANPQIFDDVLYNQQSKEAEIRIHFDDPGNRYRVQTDEGIVEIIRINFLAELSVDCKKVPLKEITQYSKVSENETIAQSAHFEIVVVDKTIDVAFHNLGEKDKTFLTARWKQKK
jgi:hypothetical protein